MPLAGQLCGFKSLPESGPGSYRPSGTVPLGLPHDITIQHTHTLQDVLAQGCC